METLSATEVILRLLASFAAGALVGWEREIRGRPAGLRTTILACLAASVAMIISQALYMNSAAEGSAGTWRPDPARLGAGILTGIGFLGAGTIIRHENFIRGVTTAACLWIVTVLGLAFGAGLYIVGATGLVFTVGTLLVLPELEKSMKTDWYVTLRITIAGSGCSEEALMGVIQSRGMTVLAMKLHWDQQTASRKAEFDLKCKRQDRFALCASLIREFSQIPGVVEVQWT